MGEPAEILHDGIEFVPMDHQDPFAISGGLDVILLQCDARKISVKLRKKLVVISNDVDDFASFAAFAVQLLDHVVVFLRPIDPTPKRPDIYEVTDEIEFVELMAAEKVE